MYALQSFKLYTIVTGSKQTALRRAIKQPKLSEQVETDKGHHP